MKFLYKLAIASGIVEWGYFFYIIMSPELIDLAIILILAGIAGVSFYIQGKKDNANHDKNVKGENSE